MATIRKLKSGRYQVIVRKKDLPALTRTFQRKADAQRFERLVETDAELALKLGLCKSLIPSFNEWASAYMNDYKGRDPSTVGRLRWWEKRFDGLPMTSIDPCMVDEGLLALQEIGRTGSTINRYRSTLSAVFIHFSRHPEFKRLGFKNPVRDETVSRFKENPRKERFLTCEEQKALLLACRDSRWDKLYLLVLMALTSGARRGELLGLRWPDIDFKARTASLATTKNGKPRLLPLTHAVIEEMVKFRENSNSLLFSGKLEMDKPMDIKMAWQYALKRAGISECRFHDLRHTAASNLVRNGKTLFEVGTLLGHSSADMTWRYSHLAIHDTQSMVDEIMGGLK